MSLMKQGMRQYERMYTLLTMGGNDMPMEKLMRVEKVESAVMAVLKMISNLPVANAAFDLAEAGRSFPGIKRDVTIAIEKLFYARGKELLAETTDVKRLQKWDKQMDAYVKKEKSGCLNNYKSEIRTRVEELSK